MGSFSAFHWIILLVIVGIPLLLIFTLFKASPDEVADTWKFRTVLWVILAFIVPLWLITLPLFLFLAWRSYRAGRPPNGPATASVQAPQSSTADELAKLVALKEKGALTDDEFASQKAKLLG